jgi:AraC-like DNA-binding protein
MMAVTLNTDAAPPPRRIAMWQDIVCDVFVQLDCSTDLRDDFHGSVAQTMIGPVSCTLVESSRQRVFRTPSRIARAKEEFVLASLGVNGTGAVIQDGREAVVRPGEFAIYDTTRPYELRFEANFSQRVFQMPRKLLQQRIGATDRFTATTFAPNRPLERVAIDFLTGVSRVIDQIGPEAGERLSHHALDLLSMAMSERLHEGPPNQSIHRSTLLYRLKCYVASRLRDPTLSLDGAAAALGITPRYANALLAHEEKSFGRYVLGQRLEHCRRDLTDPLQARRHITEIAFAWGFNELAHFSRSFKERYGVSPRECRHRAAALGSPSA